MKGRKSLLFTALFLAVCGFRLDPAGSGPPASAPFDYVQVIEKARYTAEQPYENPDGRIPEFLLKIGYEQWRDIRFKPEKSLWRGEGLPFEVQFFHPGSCYNRTVVVNVVDSEGVRHYPFSPELFDYGMNPFKDKIPAQLGFSGFRLHFPLNKADYFDEVAVFLGASYFRAIGRSQNYGVSARGLALDTALDTGEEFPYFKEFWIRRPEPQTQEMWVYALLDSPSLAGAYRFLLKPGEETLMEVEATMFLRKPVKKMGIAPMTSMFFYGENSSQRPTDDFRPEVHDSDGLMIASGSGEWIWRPLLNPRMLSVNSFVSKDPAGFGLLQSDLNFDHYQDLDLHFETRPSLWIKPGGDWGEGHVELIEIPSPADKHDNIIAFWVPKDLPEPHKPVTYSYEMVWCFPKAHFHPGGCVFATRTFSDKEKGTRKFLIEFQGGRLESLPANAAVEAVVTVVGEWADLTEKRILRNTATGGLRLIFQISPQKKGALERVFPDKRAPLELRAFLKEGNDVLTETWSYAIQP